MPSRCYRMEPALPREALSVGARREKAIRHGHRTCGDTQKGHPQPGGGFPGRVLSSLRLG